MVSYKKCSRKRNSVVQFGREFGGTGLFNLKPRIVGMDGWLLVNDVEIILVSQNSLTINFNFWQN